MSVFVIADLHLSTHAETNKSMEVFGRRWENYTERLRQNWRAVVSPADTVVVPGDISWATTLTESVPDMHFIDDLPGKKILLKGNHDFWWCTMKKHRELFAWENITTVDFLFNNALPVENFILAGSRGWFFDEDSVNLPNDPDFDKINARELARMKTSLTAAAGLKKEYPDREILAFTHFPVVFGDRRNQPFLDLLSEYGVCRCFYGHVHGAPASADIITTEGIEFILCAADHLGFLPRLIR